MIDDGLAWQEHVDSLCHKLYSTISLAVGYKIMFSTVYFIKIINFKGNLMSFPMVSIKTLRVCLFLLYDLFNGVNSSSIENTQNKRFKVNG